MVKYTSFASPLLGNVILVATDAGLSHVILPDITSAQAECATKKTMRAQREDNAFIDVKDVLLRYSAGEHIAFTHILLDLNFCTLFQRAVYNITRQIPYGETRSYKWIAERLDKPQAARAVGQAMARNPLPILIPCHRIIGSDGSLTGFGLGLTFKEKLLNLEQST